ncbi:endochitinase A [Etheostoma cragini]|uniref:endochitinase A n=1 Tax=Etheostoma cragini TaxID=417921 RepID=UPI00155EF25A|nr:endochitinase A [Etheostoma cragini]
MDDGDKLCCVLCQRSEETTTTGPLSTNNEVTAHQNCLLFSSGLFCRNSPQFDDLFGFLVEDVLSEVKRGNKLICNKCKLKGATAGCEVGRCKKSYHYPCAVKAKATIVEDADGGKYGLYCYNHSLQTQENNGAINGSPSSSSKSRTSKTPSEAGSSKIFCLACEKTEGNISLESSTNSVVVSYCDKHAPASHRRNTSGGSTSAGQPSVYSTDSNSSSSAARSSSKRQLNSTNKQEETPSKRKSKGYKRIVLDDSNSGDHVLDSEMAIFAPLETDLDESANSVPETQLIRKDTEGPTGFSSEHLEEENKDDSKDEDETVIHSDAESESLLLPMSLPHLVTVSTQTAPASLPAVVLLKAEAQRVDTGSRLEQSSFHSPHQHIAGPSVPKQSSARPLPPPDHSKPCRVTHSPPCTSSAISPGPPGSTCVSLLSPSSLPSDPEPTTYSTSFWKNCNLAGCTQAIFTGFLNEMNDIAIRIQADQASQEDYDIALTVMRASTKLAELVAKQKEELERKLKDLQKAAAAMEEVASALR